MFLRWRGRLYANLPATVRFIGTGLMDDGNWLRGTNVRSTKDPGLNGHLLVEMSRRQSLNVSLKNVYGVVKMSVRQPLNASRKNVSHFQDVRFYQRRH